MTPKSEPSNCFTYRAGLQLDLMELWKGGFLVTLPPRWRQWPLLCRRLQHRRLNQSELGNQLRAPRLGAEQQGDDEGDRGAGGCDQHRNGEAEWLAGGEV